MLKWLKTREKNVKISLKTLSVRTHRYIHTSLMLFAKVCLFRLKWLFDSHNGNALRHIVIHIPLHSSNEHAILIFASLHRTIYEISKNCYCIFKHFNLFLLFRFPFAYIAWCQSKILHWEKRRFRIEFDFGTISFPLMRFGMSQRWYWIFLFFFFGSFVFLYLIFVLLLISWVENILSYRYYSWHFWYFHFQFSPSSFFFVLHNELTAVGRIYWMFTLPIFAHFYFFYSSSFFFSFLFLFFCY